MAWAIKRTDTFLKHLKKHRHHHDLLEELDGKIRRLKRDPKKIGGRLAGTLHGKLSTRLAKNYRLIFLVDEENKTVYLVALDHRGKVYG